MQSAFIPVASEGALENGNTKKQLVQGVTGKGFAWEIFLWQRVASPSVIPTEGQVAFKWEARKDLGWKGL